MALTPSEPPNSNSAVESASSSADRRLRFAPVSLRGLPGPLDSPFGSLFRFPELWISTPGSARELLEAAADLRLRRTLLVRAGVSTKSGWAGFLVERVALAVESLCRHARRCAQLTGVSSPSSNASMSW